MALHSVGYTLCIECTADDVVTNTREVLNTAATDQNNRVLLKVVADTRNVSGSFDSIGKAYSCNFTQRGVWFLWCLGSDCSTYTTFLWRILVDRFSLQGVPSFQKSWSGRLFLYRLSAFTN